MQPKTVVLRTATKRSRWTARKGAAVLPALTQYFTTRQIQIVGANCSTTAPEGATYEFVIKGTWGDLEILSHRKGLADLAQVSRVRVG